MAKLATPLPRLTARQEDVIRFIYGYYESTLSYPTKSQISQNFGVRSNNTMAMVQPLFKKGYLKALPGRGLYEFTANGIRKLQVLGIKIPEELLVQEDAQLEIKELV